MKKIITILIAMLLLIGTVICLSSCSASIFEEKGKEGYTVGIRFDAGGGRLKRAEKTSVVELFNPNDATDTSDGMKEIKILDPEDPRRGDGLIQADKNNAFLAGWYRERHEVKDAAGNTVKDADGNPVYTYSGKWDFETDTVKIDPAKTYDPETPVMTLYAAWIPYFNYTFYAENENGVMEKLGSIFATNLTLPQWNESTGRLDYRDLSVTEQAAEKDPQNLSGLLAKQGSATFASAYYDEAMTMPVDGFINATEAYVDYAHGVATCDTIKLYTKWEDGIWFKIHTAEQFIKNAKTQANYLICADLDFSNQAWGDTFSTGTFTGTIRTEGDQVFKFSNINAEHWSYNVTTQGLFGILGDSARIENIAFENVTYTINTSYRLRSPTFFGVLAGQRNASAVLENVSLSGTVKIIGNADPNLNDAEYYTIHKVVAMGESTGVTVGEVLVDVQAEGVLIKADHTDPNKLYLFYGDQ